MAPSHYLNQCLLLISEVPWHIPESNFTLSAQATILHMKSLKIIFLKLLPHLPRADGLAPLGDAGVSAGAVMTKSGPTGVWNQHMEDILTHPLADA